MTYSIETIHPLTAAYLMAWRTAHNAWRKHGVSSDNYWDIREVPGQLLQAQVGFCDTDDHSLVLTSLNLKDLLDALTPNMDQYCALLRESICDAA